MSEDAALRRRCVDAAQAADLALGFGEPYRDGLAGLVIDTVTPLIVAESARRFAAWLTAEAELAGMAGRDCAFITLSEMVTRVLHGDGFTESTRHETGASPHDGNLT